MTESSPSLLNPDLVSNPDILAIELGAGCGNFGQRYFPECFLTDSIPINDLQKQCENGCHATICCDAYSIPCPSDRFSTIIMCNPYGYGFNTTKMANNLLNELYRVSKKDAEILILSTGSNRFANPTRVEKRVKEYNVEYPNNRFLCSYTDIDSEALYPEHIFWNVSSTKKTLPTHQIILKCLKP